MLQKLRRQRGDLHVLLVADLTCDRSEHARRARLASVVDDHDRILIEADVRAVLPARLLGGAHDHRTRHVRLLHRSVREGVLHRHDHDIAKTRVAPVGTTQHTDDERTLRAGIIGNLHHGLLLNHCSISLACALDDLDHSEALVLGQWARLHDPYRVAKLRRVLLVVSFELLGTRHHLSIYRVLHAALDGDHYGLLHLVAHDRTRAHLARVTRLRCISHSSASSHS